MRVRKKLGGRRQFGNGQNSFWRDVPDAPAQCITTRLELWLGEWFLNPPDGTPYATQILGKYTEATRDLTIKARILGTPGVKEIVSYSMSLDRFSRKLTGSVTVDTIYGAITVQGPR
jgi:hypothetical protein